MFACIVNNKLSISVTGAANKVFYLEEVNNLSLDKVSTYDYNRIDLERMYINSDIHASSKYRVSLIKNMLPKLIENIF